MGSIVLSKIDDSLIFIFGLQGTAPLDFKEISTILKDTVAKEGGQENLLRMGSCYSAQKKAPSGEAARLQKLEAQVQSIVDGGHTVTTTSKRARSRGGGGGAGGAQPPPPKVAARGGGGGGRGRGGRGGGANFPAHLIQKLQQTCSAW